MVLIRYRSEVTMVRILMLITLIVFSLIGLDAAAETQTPPVYADQAVSRLFENDGAMLIPKPYSNSIDLTIRRNPYTESYKADNKSFTSDLSDFTRSSVVLYSALWTERTFIAPGNFDRLFTTSLPSYLHSISGWQGCEGTKARNGRCAHPRRSFFKPPLNDGDSFRTNYVEHPFAGMTFYLYFRARGYDRMSSGLGSFMLSALFEYTIEGWQQSPSFNDVIATPGLGVPIGIAVDETSSWLTSRNSPFLKVVGYMIDPMRLLVNDDKLRWANLEGVTFLFN
jgi:Domain of unknown function (DUF3943)